MKQLFAGTFLILSLLSGVAYVWQPRTESARLDRIRWLISQTGSHTVAGIRSEWDQLAGDDGQIDFRDYPEAIRMRLPFDDEASIPADALAAYLTSTTRPGYGYDALREQCRAHAGTPFSPTTNDAVAPHVVQAAEVALRRLRAALVRDALVASDVILPEAETLRARLAVPATQSFVAYLKDGPPPSEDDKRRCEELTLLLYESDLDDDGVATEEERSDYLARLDANANGEIDDYDVPERPLRLLWSSAPGAIRDRQIDAFNRRYPRHKLELDAYVSAVDRTIVQALAGVGPDLFDVITPFQLAAFVGSGVARDVTDEFAERGIETGEIWPAVKPFYMMDGRIYGHPRNAGAPAMWFNKDMFDDAGIPYPTADWTWHDFVRIAQELTVRDDAGRPLRFGFISTWDHTGWFPNMITRQWGAPMFNEAGTRCTIHGPEAIDALTFTQKLMYDYRVMPTPSDEAAMANAGGWGTGALTLFAGERGAMAIGYRWWLVVLRQPEFAHLRLGVVPLPETPSGAIEGGGGAVLVAKDAKNLEGALLFMEFLHSAAYNDLNNDEADSLSPVESYYYGGTSEVYLNNPRYPNEDYHAVWRDVLAQAQPPTISPFVNGQRAERLVMKYTDFIKYPSEGRTVSEVLQHLEDEMNRAIVDTLRQSPVLRQKYEAAVANGAEPAWDRPEEGP